MILDPGFDLNLRPMKYPLLYERYKSSIENNWTVEEVDFTADLPHLKYKLTPAETHMIQRLVAFFATGDTIVANNLVLNLYKHVNSPEARLYYSRQLFEESIHVDFYMKLVEAYIPTEEERIAAFRAVETIPSVKKKAEFAFKWIDDAAAMDQIRTNEDKKKFLLLLITFACAIEGIFFMGAFAYVYYLRNKGLLPALGEGTNWVFRDETMHMIFAFDIVDIVRNEQPELFTVELEANVREMMDDAIDCEMGFAADALQLGVLGFTEPDMLTFLRFSADQRLQRLGYAKGYNVQNPFDFMSLQELQPLTNFFEKRVAEYSAVTTGTVSFDDEF